MRLTEKNEFGYILHVKAVDNSLGNEIAIVGKTANKLGQLEDIEEELGIDLVTLFKAIKKVYYKETNEIKLSRIPTIYILEKRIEPIEGISFNLKDYGKTWSLNKSDLTKE